MQIMYGINGERRLTEIELPWLPGYENSSPVRIGNGACDQIQIDVFGELMDALHAARKSQLGPSQEAWRFQQALLSRLEGLWRDPDEGIWEVRGGRKHFVHSKMMAWVAFDRAVKTVEHSAPADRSRNGARSGTRYIVKSWRAAMTGSGIRSSSTMTAMRSMLRFC